MLYILKKPAVRLVALKNHLILLNILVAAFVFATPALAQTTTWYEDRDHDSYGNPAVSTDATSQPPGYVADNTDCDDNDAAVNPNATEVADGIDNDCDGQVDEGFDPAWYQDLDGDGFGNPAVSTNASSQPQGYVSNNTDCDDNDAAVNPNATEVADGIDNDCDGQVDEGFSTYYQDQDGDGFGNPAVSNVASSQPIGYVSDNTDCDDSRANVNPGATEIADGIDNDCDGQVDEGLDTTAPTLSITGVPGSYKPGDVFNVSFDFGENVTGFDATDITINGAVGGTLSGGPSVYTMAVTASSDASITISVPAGAAQDTAGNKSTAASATSALDGGTVAAEKVSSFTENRARNMVQNQPGLTGLITGRQQGQFSADVTRAAADLSLHSGARGPIWFAFQGAKTEYDSRAGDSVYALASLGAHTYVHSGLIIGGMLQFDYADDDQGGGVGVEGNGWMAGPYFVAQLGQQPLFVEGRALYGQSDNKISPLGTFKDSFDTERFLTMLALEGSYQADLVRFFPRLQFSHLNDRQKAYVDSLANTVPQQSIQMTELSAGVDFEVPLVFASNRHIMTWGASGIWSRTDGDGAADPFINDKDGGRVRLDLGYLFNGDEGLTASGDIFVDGLGSGDFTTVGVSLGMALEF